MACNTATAASIKALRERYPDLPVVGVEPGLKPAAAASKSGKVGVLATERTLASEKFRQLREQTSAATGVEFLLQACKGLADQVEKGELHSPATLALLNGYVTPLLGQGVDTLVLGCTHYPFVQPAIESLLLSSRAGGDHRYRRSRGPATRAPAGQAWPAAAIRRAGYAARFYDRQSGHACARHSRPCCIYIRRLRQSSHGQAKPAPEPYARPSAV